MLQQPIGLLLMAAWGVLVVVGGARAAGGTPMKVVSPDRPLPHIVAAPGQVHQAAAEDLCDYLSRVTGQKIVPDKAVPGATMTIHVGPDAFVLEHGPEINNLRGDGFIIKQSASQGKQHLVLSGIRGDSSQWAVESFLQQFCGVRWLFPDDAPYGEIVPSRSTITITPGLFQKQEPSYLFRANCQMYFFDKTRRHLRLRPSDSIFGEHAFQHIFGRADFQAHPDWFALFAAPDSDLSRFAPEALGRGERRRRWHWDYGNGWQICTSHPETVRHAIAYARDWFAKNPEAAAVSMGHNDGDGWCECERCSALAASVQPPYSRSEQYWDWVNRVARELAKSHPDKLVATIAYGTPVTPPRFELEKNIAVTVTVSAEQHLEFARQWKKKCRSVNLYSYPYGASFFAGFRHYPRAMRDFLKWGHDELRAISHVAEVYGDWSFDGPKYHYMQALQWDVNADPEAVMQEYCRDWFGAAAGPMKAFWDRLEAIYERRGPQRRLVFYQWLGWSENYDEFDHYSLADVDALNRAIAEAEQKADTEADRFRVARVADAWKYFRSLLLGKLRFCDRREAVLAQAATTPDRARQLARELAELEFQKQTWHRQLRAYPHINPHLTVEEYWSGLSHVAQFSEMRTLLDELCDLATQQLIIEGGRERAVQFWQSLKPDDPLHGAAQTQLFCIAEQHRPNVLVNGDFESGDLNGWQVSGPLSVSAGSARTGRHAAETKGPGIVTLSQSVRVRPNQKYRLSAWAQSADEQGGDLRVIMDVAWQGGGKALYPEPTFRKLAKKAPHAEWVNLNTTFSVPSAADTAVISLKSSGARIRLDDLVLQKIQDGPAQRPGVLVDDFAGSYLQDAKWAEASSGRSGALPAIESGRIVFDNGPTATLVSLARFDDLLDGSGDRRFRLRMHIAKGKAPDRPGSFECGIRTGSVPISTTDSGFFLTHTFETAAGKPDGLRTYWHQDAKWVGSGNFDIKSSRQGERDVWYTFYFDAKSVTIYAGRQGYEEGTAALVGSYEHKMTRLASRGPVFLKISGGNVALDEISLLRPPGPRTGH